MSFSRYQKRNKRTISLDNFREQVNSQENNVITHYESSQNILDKTKQNFSYTEYQWKYGDKLYKLAQRFYGDSKLWWVIAHVNMRPTDSHYKPGDTVIIPSNTQLSQIIEMLGY
jgi:nucleoid-associated protein YgaU